MKKTVLFIVIAALAAISCTREEESHHYYNCTEPEDINAFFQNQKGILISGHRGGNLTGYPENCIETFDKILESLPTVYEIDPRMTRDSMIVLMHDTSLERTTDGSGKVRDHSYAELQQYHLKDRWGNITAYKIPLVKDVVEWSKDKVILNFDIKDVTRDVLIPLVRSTGAKNCMYTVRTPEEALEVYQIDSTARMSAWIRDMEAFHAYEATGIPWANIPMAYVQSNIMKEEQSELYRNLRNAGVKCMVSTAPVEDRKDTQEERAEAFLKVLESKPDVIETDFPTELLETYMD